MNCPHCKKKFADSLHLAGKKVRCSKCSETFIFSAPAKSMREDESPSVPVQKAPPPLEVSLNESAADIGSPSIMIRKSKLLAETSASIWDIFDLQFKKYVTPLIVRSTWLFALMLAFLGLVGLIVANVPGFFGEEVTTVDPRLEIDWALIETEFSGASRFALLAIGVLSIIFFLLWIRVFLEFIIVVFNISMSLIEIEKKTGPQDAG